MITQEINNLIAKIEQLLSSLLNPNLQNDKQKNSSTKNGYDADIEDNNGLVVSCTNNKN